LRETTTTYDIPRYKKAKKQEPSERGEKRRKGNALSGNSGREKKKRTIALLFFFGEQRGSWRHCPNEGAGTCGGGGGEPPRRIKRVIPGALRAPSLCPGRKKKEATVEGGASAEAR